MKNINVIIVHGAYGYPNENWFGWMKRQLEYNEIECHVPQLPTPQHQNLQSWLKIFDDECGHLVHQNTILIGHSLGSAFSLRLLEHSSNTIATLILVGAFIGKVGIEHFDSINTSFFETEFNWACIRKKSQRIISYHGTNDPYVKEEDFNYIADNLNATKVIISNAGHFNSASGYTEFKQLLIQIKLLIKEIQYA